MAASVDRSGQSPSESTKSRGDRFQKKYSKKSSNKQPKRFATQSHGEELNDEDRTSEEDKEELVIHSVIKKSNSSRREKKPWSTRVEFPNDAAKRTSYYGWDVTETVGRTNFHKKLLV